MKSTIPMVPELWLLIIIVGLPQFSETVYTPALPDIARSLVTSDAMVEYTLTIYLFGFALGTLFWGKLSDKYGRKPVLLVGLFLYLLGCLGCYYATTISGLMIARLLQAFGGSTGSVLGQAICRDAFEGPAKGKVFSIIGSALAFSPAVGPIIGGLIDQWYGWSAIFLFLIVMGFFTFAASILRLPETHTPTHFSWGIIIATIVRMARDKKILAYGFLVAACNGIGFSYYAEGSFYLIDLLGLSPSFYGLSFIVLAFAGMMGGYASKKLHDVSWDSFRIAYKGGQVILGGASLFVGGTFLGLLLQSALWSIALTLASMGIMMAGIGLMIPNVLSVALEEYKATIGTASSLFGFYYYCLISLCTLIMGLLHNDTLLPMPLFFFVLAVAILGVLSFIRFYTERATGEA